MQLTLYQTKIAAERLRSRTATRSDLRGLGALPPASKSGVESTPPCSPRLEPNFSRHVESTFLPYSSQIYWLTMERITRCLFTFAVQRSAYCSISGKCKYTHLPENALTETIPWSVDAAPEKIFLTILTHKHIQTPCFSALGEEHYSLTAL